MSKRIITSLVITAVLGSSLTLAGQRLPLNTEVKQQIKTALTEQGYQVAKIKIEDGFYEAYARKDGMRYEVYLDTDMKIVRVKED